MQSDSTEKPRDKNPLMTLADGTQLRLLELDWLNNEEHGDIYWDYVLGDEDEIKTAAPAPPVDASQQSDNRTDHERRKAKIESLTAELEQLHQKQKESGFDAAIWKEIRSQTAVLADLKDRVRHEEQVMETHRRRFLANSFGDEEDFARLWNATMRDEAMKRDAEDLENLRRVASHSIYREF